MHLLAVRLMERHNGKENIPSTAMMMLSSLTSKVGMMTGWVEPRNCERVAGWRTNQVRKAFVVRQALKSFKRTA